MPIARETLVGLCGVGRSSQRNYEKRVGLQPETNIAIGEPATKEATEDRAWTHGQAVFELKDFRGYQGKKGKTYLAWQLPNSYIGSHVHRPKGRQRRINRQLNDLVMKGMLGNVENVEDESRPGKTYFTECKQAIRSSRRSNQPDCYWKQNQSRDRYYVWQSL